MRGSSCLTGVPFDATIASSASPRVTDFTVDISRTSIGSFEELSMSPSSSLSLSGLLGGGDLAVERDDGARTVLDNPVPNEC